MLLKPVSLVVSFRAVVYGAGAVAAQTARTTVSLDEAVQLALQRNATLRAKEHELHAARANEITAGLRPNPTASYLTEQIFSSGTPQYAVTP